MPQPDNPGRAPVTSHPEQAGPGHKQQSGELLRSIGYTPLIELERVTAASAGTRLFAKLESVNPGGSIKDRPVARMLREGIKAGLLDNGRRLLDSSSGNAGISYAMLGAALNIPVTIVVPGNASRERLDRIAMHGAELILTDPIKGYDFALHEARRIADEQQERYWYCNQYTNDNNWRAHYEGTAEEILGQLKSLTGVLPDVFVAGVGTGGTITGIGRRLKEVRSDIHIVAAIPDRFPGIEGLKPLGQPDDIVPDILDESVIDERIDVTIEDAIAMCKRLAGEGLFVGPSSGAFVHVALKVAATNKYKNIVTVLSDTGERYGSTGMWSTGD